LSVLFFQNVSAFFDFKLSSSLPNSLIIIAIGENTKKKIIPKTIGLTTLPIINPIDIQNLLNELNNDGLVRVIIAVSKNRVIETTKNVT
tara:strand:+ start:824 stop:1090 length:267 start_codon:yes stop_codon:yes gene_type:complete